MTPEYAIIQLQSKCCVPQLKITLKKAIIQLQSGFCVPQLKMTPEEATIQPPSGCYVLQLKMTMKGFIIKSGCSVPQFAASLGVSKCTLYSHINNKSDVTPKLAKQIVEKLNGAITLDDIYYR